MIRHCTEVQHPTDRFKSKHPRYIIYVCNKRNSDSFLFTLDKLFLEFTSRGNHSPVYCASFGTFCVQISQLFEPQWVFKDSREIVFGDIFLRRRRNPDFFGIFKHSLWLEYLSNIDSKGTKRGAMNRAINF